MKGAAHCGCALSSLVAQAGTVKRIHKQELILIPGGIQN
jgi:hypothetical protein